MLTQTLQPLPDDVMMTMKLYYYDDGNYHLTNIQPMIKPLILALAGNYHLTNIQPMIKPLILALAGNYHLTNIQPMIKPLILALAP